MASFILHHNLLAPESKLSETTEIYLFLFCLQFLLSFCIQSFSGRCLGSKTGVMQSKTHLQYSLYREIVATAFDLAICYN